MSTVDEVLATAEVVDAVCVIDGETRIISVPNEYKELGVESDEKVTRVKFQCPKIVGDNIDLTEYNLYINYRNAGNKLNSYLVEDVTVTGDTINFSWLLSRHVTESPGTISYIVCAKKSDDTGVINEWNTKVATGIVGIGLEATEEIEEQNIDVIEQILRSIVELENGSGSSSIAVDATLSVSGHAADAKATGDAISSLTEEIANKGNPTDEQVSNAVNDWLNANPGYTTVGVDKTFITEDIGELYAAPSDYSAWCPGNLRWDKNLQKFVSLIYAAPAHVHSTADLYVCYIDPDSFSATQPEKCRYVDTDGETDITPDTAGTCSFLILSDGTYLMMHLAADGNTYKFTSADNGATWKKVSAVTGYSGSPWNMTELSNGRVIMSDDASKVGFYYSDDGGVTFTQVIPGTCGGGYEAEACILEVRPGKLIAIARYSMSGKGYHESGDSEAAIFASSDDYGTTWSDWHISTTIDNMNASSCTGVVHDGIVEIFATSRWYSNGSNVNTDNANTGKNGAMIHYMATVANALIDNFTRVGIIDYARGAGGEYHSPCAAIDADNRLLIVHMDGGEAATCNNRYLRGGIGNISYACTDNSSSTVKAFSAATVTKLLAEKQESINHLQLALSKIEGSGVTPPTGTSILVAQYIAADMASSLIYPWSSGSDFNGNSDAQYSVDTGATSTVHEFLVDDSGETYLKTYGCVVRPIKSENATDCYIKVEGNSIGAIKTHCILNGYITVADTQNEQLVSLSTSGHIVIKSKLQAVTTLEVHDGYCIFDGTKYELPRVAVDDFLTNYTGYTYFGRHGRITELWTAGDKDIVTTSDQCGILLEGYHRIYSIKYYETY